MTIRPKTGDDQDWICSLLKARWCSAQIVTRNKLHQADMLPAFIAIEGDQPKGLVTYEICDGDCEIVSLDSLDTGKGIGTALIDKVMDVARAENCNRVWLITTNDNTGAMRFYQKHGFSMAALHRDAIIESRKRKPIIPAIGLDGIPIRDEVEFEVKLRA